MVVVLLKDDVETFEARGTNAEAWTPSGARPRVTAKATKKAAPASMIDNLFLRINERERKVNGFFVVDVQE